MPVVVSILASHQFGVRTLLQYAALVKEHDMIRDELCDWKAEVDQDGYANVNHYLVVVGVRVFSAREFQRESFNAIVTSI